MATRMQQRRGTAAQWTAADPILAAGEIGFESDTGQFKIGDGVNHWDDISYFKNLEDLGGSLDDYIPVDTKAVANGVASLDAQGRVPLSQLGNVIDGAPGALNTLNELAAAISNDATFASTVMVAISQKVSADTFSNHTAASTNIHGIADTALLATKVYADGKASDAQTAAITAAGTAADTKVSTHSSSTTNVHGISDTSALALTATVNSGLALKANLASPTFTGTVSGITKSMVGLGSVDNTADTAKPVSTATQTALDAKLALAGGTLTGALTLSGAPTSDLHAATKLYVDGLAAGMHFHQPVVAATSGNLAGTYNNGTSGVGATLTSASNASIGTIDGISVSVGNRILLRAQTDATQNGIYTITAVGSGSAPWQITRATDSDNNPAGELASGDFCFVTGGSTNGSKGFIVSTTGTITLGTTSITYSQFNASEAVTAGTNITKTGATIAVADAPTFSGAVTASSGVVFSDGTQTKEGVVSRTPIIAKTDSYTLSALTERDSLIEVAKSTATTITIPTDATLNFPIGTSLDILQTSTGQVTIAGASGVTVNATPGLKLRTQWSSATLFKRAANTWVVYGDLMA